MTFLNSIKLFCSNWEKVLKLFLYYLFSLAITALLLLPVILVFKDVINENINSALVTSNYLTVFHSTFGGYLNGVFSLIFEIVSDAFMKNAGLVVYAFLVVAIFLPFLFNVGKYVICEMLYGYMANKSRVSFFGVFFKTLNRSLLYALCKTFYDLVFVAVVVASVFSVGLVENVYFQTYFLPLCVFLILVVAFTLSKVSTTCWAPAMIVLGVSVDKGYRRGARVVARHFGRALFVNLILYVCFFAFTYMVGIYSLVVTVPLLTALLCMFDMITFFSSQGMRYYINSKIIMTPKKLEEVDSFKKTKYII